MKPRIYYIEGVLTKNKMPIDSTLIADGNELDDSLFCDSCRCPSYANPYNYFVQGFDDLKGLDIEVKLFISQGPPLIAAKEHIEMICSELTGVTQVQVGFKQWNQERWLDASEYFNQTPQLGAIFINSVCSKVYDENGKPLKKCSKCKMNVFFSGSMEDDLDKFSIEFSDWNGTDMFLIEGAMQSGGSVITEVGLNKLLSATLFVQNEALDSQVNCPS